MFSGFITLFMPWKEDIQFNGKVIAKVRELSRNVVCVYIYI